MPVVPSEGHHRRAALLALRRRLLEDMKIILSRKGFDSAWGGRPSPILPDGRMVSFPIPDPRSGLRYADIRLADGQTCLDLMHELGVSTIRDGRKVVDLTPALQAHLDPDLVPEHRPRPPGWRPLFGQVNRALSHLINHRVGRGDLFLFFGWFRPTRSGGGRLQYSGPSGGVHALFGYLEIEDVVELGPETDLPWAANHPHVRCKSTRKDWRRNIVFVAAPRCSLRPALPGAGVFHYHEQLVLTAPGEPRSVWKLPPAFHPANTRKPLTCHPIGRWVLNGDHVLLQSTPIGQEFIVEANEGIDRWVTDLFGMAELPKDGGVEGDAG